MLLLWSSEQVRGGRICSAKLDINSLLLSPCSFLSLSVPFAASQNDFRLALLPHLCLGA